MFTSMHIRVLNIHANNKTVYRRKLSVILSLGQSKKRVRSIESRLKNNSAKKEKISCELCGKSTTKNNKAAHLKTYCPVSNPNKTDKRKILVTCDYCGCKRTSKDLMKRHLLYKHYRKKSLPQTVLVVERELYTATVSSPLIDACNVDSDTKKLMKSLQNTLTVLELESRAHTLAEEKFNRSEYAKTILKKTLDSVERDNEKFRKKVTVELKKRADQHRKIKEKHTQGRQRWLEETTRLKDKARWLSEENKKLRQKQNSNK